MIRSSVAVAAVVLTGMLAMRGAEAGEKPAAAAVTGGKGATAPLDPPTREWRSDPACQMVFFAVLEGLFTDGVPDEAVDLIVPPKAKGDDGVKHTFVFRCPLCHAAYEAFVQYQHRTGFHGSNEAKSTLGATFDPKITEGLKSKEVRTRVYAMGAMIRPWIERRMTMMNMGAKEQSALLAKLLEHAGRGQELFNTYRAVPKSVYQEWMFYGGCQACEAAEAVARKIAVK
jgi:hypothetical protein